MVRYFGILLGCFFLCTTIAKAADTPVMVVNAPKQAVAGTSFIVSVEITNAEMQGIARFMQTLPYGVTIEPGECANSDFEFSNQTLKLMWFSLRKTSSLKFTYKVVTHSNIKGVLDLSGSFVYINPSNVHTTANAKSVAVEITPSPNANPSSLVDLKNFKGKQTQETNLTFIPATQQIESLKMVSKALRQTPSYDPKTDTYLVSILLDKGKASKYAKLEESIPAEYTAEPVETRGGVFDYSNGKVKFLWLELPNQPRYLVSYRLKPKSKQADGKKIEISGYFAFMVDDATEIHEVAQVQTDLKNFASNTDTQKGVAKFTPGGREIPIKYVGIEKSSQPTQKVETAKEDPKQVAPKAAAANNVTTPSTIAAKNTVIADKIDTKAAKPVEEKSKAVTEKKVAEGVTFKVQLAAVSKEADKAGAADKFKTDKPIAKEEAAGMVRYLVGPFASYQEAEGYKEKVKHSGFKDAFIAAYNKQGVRITINEAFASVKK
jgi:hypothetical protein